MDDVDVGELQTLPAAVRERQRPAAARRKRDPPAIRRPRWAEISALAGRQRLRMPACDIERPQIGSTTGASGDECELLAVGRKRRLIVVRGTVGQSFETGAVRLYAKEIRRALSV